MKKLKSLTLILVLISPTLLFAENNKIPGITISDSAVAILDPIGTYATPVSVLNYDPRVDLQERNLTEGQADIAIRGGTFEGTGVKIGSVGLLDPQTGHYVAELPFSPMMLSRPEVLTGLDNTIYGFNATAGTISYGLKAIKDDINLRTAVGTHNLNLQEGYVAKQDLINNGTGSLNLDLDAAHSEMDGTRANGQHDFERFSGRLQWINTRSQTDLMFGYQDKYFNWPYLYALPELHNAIGSSGVESESLRTSLALFNHRVEYNDQDYFEVSSYFREHKDNYELDVSRPALFNQYRHKSEVYGTGFSGENKMQTFDLKYTGQVIFEDLDSSALTYNEFNTRSFGKFALTPEKTITLTETDNLIFTAGTAYDRSDRDDSEFSPVAGATWDFDNEFSKEQKLYLEYAKSTKVPGYTALASNPTAGLFKGNQDLSRENSHNIELGYDLNRGSIQTHIASFYRQDLNLVDWTYSSATQPFASRTATNVDIDVYGIESFVSKKWNKLNLVLGYTFLKKNEDYSSTDIDASFYALNYPNHRFTTSLIYNIEDNLVFRVDNEYRKQEDNFLRNSEEQTIFTAVSTSWTIPDYEQISLFLAVDNLWKVNFEDIPGVPGRGRLFSAGLNYKLN